MEAFSRIAPEWTYDAIHVTDFQCPSCQASPRKALRVWLNRYAPVTTSDNVRRWQEFYLCECGQSWWGWNDDRQK